MKKTPTTEAAEPAESYDRLNKSALPKIGYNRAMASYFIVPKSNAIRSVECATAEEFAALVREVTFPSRTQRNRQLLKSCLAGLDYAENLSKWYCVCEIMAAGGRLSLFATVEAARQSAQKETLEV